jgi:hypothetical protein
MFRGNPYFARYNAIHKNFEVICAGDAYPIKTGFEHKFEAKELADKFNQAFKAGEKYASHKIKAEGIEDAEEINEDDDDKDEYDRVLLKCLE